jgi:hypothetical protein
VTYPVGRTLRLAWALAGLWLAGVTAVVWALFSGSALMHRPSGAVFLAASIVVAGLACLTFWRSQRARMLLWDGERWSLEPGNDDGYSEMARLQVRMDLQQAMLLSFEDPYAGRRRIWLWAEAAHHPVRWHLLRCALYSSTVPAAPELSAGERV